MSATNANSRLEAFCDAVFAIAITLLVIEIKIPNRESILTTIDLWTAIGHIWPSLFAFLLSFTVILITWVNHHNILKLVTKTSNPFIYANGFLLLTVAFIPFPTTLLGEFILTDHATPAVALYNFTLAIQALGWIMLNGIAVKHGLCKNEKATKIVRNGLHFGYLAFVLYTVCGIVAFRFPFAINIITTLTWIFWLIFGIRIKEENE